MRQFSYVLNCVMPRHLSVTRCVLCEDIVSCSTVVSDSQTHPSPSPHPHLRPTPTRKLGVDCYAITQTIRMYRLQDVKLLQSATVDMTHAHHSAVIE